MFSDPYFFAWFNTGFCGKVYLPTWISDEFCYSTVGNENNKFLKMPSVKNCGMDAICIKTLWGSSFLFQHSRHILTHKSNDEVVPTMVLPLMCCLGIFCYYKTLDIGSLNTMGQFFNNCFPWKYYSFFMLVEVTPINILNATSLAAEGCLYF